VEANLSNPMKRLLKKKGFPLFLELIARWKHPGFIEEKEYRFVSFPQNSENKYIIKSNLTKNYIEIPINIKCVKKIIIGPQKDMKLKSQRLKDFLMKKNLDIKVSKSGIPFIPYI